MKTQDQVGRSDGGSSKSPSVEREVSVFSGWLMLLVNVALLFLGIFLFARSLYEFNALQHAFPVARFVASILMFLLAVLFLTGHFTLQPNQARVLILFGAYHGTSRQSGFHWANPFYAKGTKVPFDGPFDKASHAWPILGVRELDEAAFRLTSGAILS